MHSCDIFWKRHDDSDWLAVRSCPVKISVYLRSGYKGFCQIICDTVDFQAFLSVQIEKMNFLSPGYNTKDLESKQNNKWRWAWLSECATNGDKWGL